jgi:hypothetical protein
MGDQWLFSYGTHHPIVVRTGLEADVVESHVLLLTEAWVYVRNGTAD